MSESEELLAALSRVAALRRENTTLNKSRAELAKQLNETREELLAANEAETDADELRENNEQLRAQVSALEEQVRLLQRLDYPAPETTSHGQKSDHDKLVQELQAVTETSKQHEQNNRILLEEVETQEFEIERLFKENSHLHSQLEELATVTRDWQAQCEDISLQNERLQEMLQESASWSFEQQEHKARLEAEGKLSEEDHVKELNLLKDQVFQFEKLYREEQALNAKMDNELRHLEMKKLELIEQKNDIHNTFVPILATVEDKLLRMQSNKNKISKNQPRILA